MSGYLLFGGGGIQFLNVSTLYYSIDHLDNTCNERLTLWMMLIGIRDARTCKIFCELKDDPFIVIKT